MKKKEYYIICIDDQAWTYLPCHQDALGGPGTFDNEELVNHHRRQVCTAKKTARPAMHKTSEWYMGKSGEAGVHHCFMASIHKSPKSLRLVTLAVNFVQVIDGIRIERSAFRNGSSGHE